jgi:hypothetical protein
MQMRLAHADNLDFKKRQEQRTCAILNRFTIESTVVFMTHGSSTVLKTPVDSIVGHSIFDFIDPSDHDKVHCQIATVKETNRILYLEFSWIAPTEEKLSVESILTASSDGVVCVLQRIL